MPMQTVEDLKTAAVLFCHVTYYYRQKYSKKIMVRYLIVVTLRIISTVTMFRSIENTPLCLFYLIVFLNILSGYVHWYHASSQRVNTEKVDIAFTGQLRNTWTRFILTSDEFVDIILLIQYWDNIQTSSCYRLMN